MNCVRCSPGSAGAFPEWVQLVGHTIEIYDLLYEFIMEQTFEIVAILQSPKNEFSLILNVFRKGKPCSLLIDTHCADLADPVVKIREEKAINDSVMFKVNAICFRLIQPFHMKQFC